MKKEQEIELKNYFTAQKDVEFVLLFGSVSSGRVTTMSDVDIAVYFNNGDILRISERQIEITCAVMEICHINRVDVVVLNIANPFLAYQVVKYGKIIYNKNEKLFYRFKAVSLGIYQDIKPMYELYDRAAEDMLRRGAYG